MDGIREEGGLAPAQLSGTAPRRTGLRRPSSGARGGWERAGGSGRCAAAQHPSCRRPRDAWLGADDVPGPAAPRAAPRSTRLSRAARSGGPSGLSAWLAAPKGSEPKAGGCNLWACRGRFLSRDPAHSRAHQVAFPPPPQPLSKTSSFYLPLRFSSGSHF